MNFSAALERMKNGQHVSRSGWNAEGMFLFLVPGSTITVMPDRPLGKVFGEGAEIQYQPHIDMYTAQKTVVPWLASQTDILAEDWRVVNGHGDAG